jgi:7-keto-8-aminopelargonate synthetase-like enzyme
LGTLPALCGKDDVILLDKLAHASLIDAAKLSGAALRVFPHNHLEKLERLLKGASENRKPGARVLIVTESIFSMDGDASPLREIVDLAERHDAALLVDEAHAVGVLGPNGRGLVAELGLEKWVALQMGTLSKAVGLSGGYIAASAAVIELLINKARSLIYSTAPPPALAFAAIRALQMVAGQNGDTRRARLREHKAALRAVLGDTVPSDLPAAIVPLIVGDERAATVASANLLDQGFLIPAIRYPTVARGKARLRLTLSAAHEPAHLASLAEALSRTGIIQR